MNDPTRISRQQHIALVATALVFAVTGLGGCGGSGSESDRKSDTPSTQSATTPESTSGEAGFSTSECTATAAQVAKASEALNPTATDDLGEGFAAIEKVLGTIKDVASSDPVKSAAGRLESAYGDLASHLEGVQYSGSGTPPPAFVDAVEGLDYPAVLYGSDDDR